MDCLGRASLYDLALASPRGCISVTNLPNMPRIMMQPMSVAAGENGLFLLSDSEPHFLALKDGRLYPNSTYPSKANWYWKSLPRPPFAVSGYSCDNQNEISAYTVAGNSKIWASAVGAGTFVFDPESGGAWNKAGDWALPFSGRAEYLPEHNLWFGFSHGGTCLCASDLTAVPQKVWRDVEWPEDWKLRATQLLPLGSGKLCVTRIFITAEEADDMSLKPEEINNYVVLSGEEVVSRQGMIRFIKHKSQRYSLGRDMPDPL